MADPHGDPIPNRRLEVDDRSAADDRSTSLPANAPAIVRVSDSEPQMLRYLTEQGIGIGAELELVERQPFDGPCLVRLPNREARSLGIRLAQAIHVERV